MVEIKKGVFRDPDEIYVAASTGDYIQYRSSEK